MTKRNEPSPAGDEQTIEELQERYQKLNTRKIRADRDLEHATKQLNGLKQEAREKYGTDDIAELRKKLSQMTAENEEKRSKYQADLNQIESDLAEVERTFAASENPPTAGEGSL